MYLMFILRLVLTTYVNHSPSEMGWHSDGVREDASNVDLFSPAPGMGVTDVIKIYAFGMPRSGIKPVTPSSPTLKVHALSRRVYIFGGG